MSNIDYRVGATVVCCNANAMHWMCRGQVVKWSLVRPAACMKECITVGPTSLNPLLTISLLMASDFDVFTGILWLDLY